ncbi:MAG: hypothetical protein HY721_24730, partial [Planctomycetes bacterium]|nr:hypothetical protein [Planctomycetota bacterium]
MTKTTTLCLIVSGATVAASAAFLWRSLGPDGCCGECGGAPGGAIALALEEPKAAGAAEKKEGGSKQEAAAQDPAKGALEGRVTLEGEAPQVKGPEIPANHQDREKCAGHVKQEKLVLSEKKEVKDAVISVANFKPSEKPKPRSPTLDNKDCTFVPHVQATTVGSTLKLTNSDSFLHNTRGVLSLSFNNAIGAGQSIEKPLKKPGWGVVSCDFHGWMQAHIWVFAHDLFDVSKADGSYRIPNIPPGEYEIEVW